eukprot:CAMPEP_0184533986 /NCGR_PEP_ID=MMETSP0198_2-20121128/15080_1 /TAXON_ID=1112570 /ORGANISM="Thraustochytrium sp., Strain LLF1b" /LENGTH=63 /DNA_ID=CAMNT_0026926861 /DNA_START=45 /DNA_END=232 /DNA_ORIENTATION=+
MTQLSGKALDDRFDAMLQRLGVAQRLARLEHARRMSRKISDLDPGIFRVVASMKAARRSGWRG